MKGRVNTGGGGGLNASVILVAAPTGSTVTCTKGGTTKTAVEKNGHWTFRGIENGEWTVKATKGGQSTSQPVNVTQFDVYRVTLAYFNATIETTFPTDCTSVTCKKGATTLSVPSGSLSSGSYTFNIPETGEWVLYATNGTKEKAVTVNVAEETEYTAALSFELMAFLNGVTDPSIGGWDGATVRGSILKFQPTNGTSKSGFSNNKLDLRGYKTMTVHVKTISSQLNSRSKVGVSTEKQDGSNFTASATMPTGGGVWSDSDITRTIDITNVDSGYIKFWGSSSSSSAQLYLDIDKILLE